MSITVESNPNPKLSNLFKLIPDSVKRLSFRGDSHTLDISRLTNLATLSFHAAKVVYPDLDSLQLICHAENICLVGLHSPVTSVKIIQKNSSYCFFKNHMYDDNRHDFMMQLNFLPNFKTTISIDASSTFLFFSREFLQSTHHKFTPSTTKSTGLIESNLWQREVYERYERYETLAMAVGGTMLPDRRTTGVASYPLRSSHSRCLLSSSEFPSSLVEGCFGLIVG